MQPSMLVICYGVSGCGKSTAARYIADNYPFLFVEADDFHSQENKAHMAAGKPLNDAMREPWILALSSFLEDKLANGKHCVMANSCLKKSYRDRYRDIGFPIVFFHLKGEKTVISERMQQRENHFMPASLLDSQFATLESSEAEADVIDIDINRSIPEICAELDTHLKNILHM